MEESRMKFNNRYAFLAIAAVLFAAGIAMFSSRAGAQDEGWQIVRAEYGTKSQHNDVTDILKDLVGRGGVNGRVAVNNQTMGGDPAVGADKHLRIWARNRRGEEREFDYKEGGFIDAAMFAVRRDRDDWNDRPANPGDRDDYPGVRIIRAYYGWQANTINVTEALRSRMRDGISSHHPRRQRPFASITGVFAGARYIVPLGASFSLPKGTQRTSPKPSLFNTRCRPNLRRLIYFSPSLRAVPWSRQLCFGNRRNSKIKYTTTARLITRARLLPTLTRLVSS